MKLRYSIFCLECSFFIYSWSLNKVGIRGAKPPDWGKSKYNLRSDRPIQVSSKPTDPSGVQPILRLSSSEVLTVEKNLCVEVDCRSSNLCCSRVNCRAHTRSTGNFHHWSWFCCCCCWVASVMSDSVRPQRWQPTRLLCPWDSPGKNTGVGCHFLLQCMKVKSGSEVAQSCPTLSNPMDCSLSGSSIHGIFQARVLEWGATAFSAHIHNYNKKVINLIFFSSYF